MENTIAKLLPEGALPTELLTALQEAFDKRVAEAREQAEVAIREELAARYEHDKAVIVEAMDRMISDVVQKQETEKAAAVQSFVEARNAFRVSMKESRRELRAKLHENEKVTRAFVTEQLTKHIVKLREQKKALVAEKLSVAEELASLKESLAAAQTKRFAKIDEFVVRQVKAELNEFQIDRRALVETRVKLVAEGRKKIRETQSRFVKEAARTVEKAYNAHMSRELRQLHEDIERNRKNDFGRRLFETFAAEYLTSYMNEGSEINKLQKKLSVTESEVQATKAKLDEAVKESQVARRRAVLAEERASRSKIMGELLNNLRGEKRAVMEGLLETTKTADLRTSFNKLLPTVLEGAARKPLPQGKAVLTETNKRVAPAKPATVVTGEQRNRLFETARAENDFEPEMARLISLAGIQKK